MDERTLTREELQEEQATRLLEKLEELEPGTDEYKETLQSYNSIMETSNKERELAATECANDNDKKKNITTVCVTAASVFLSLVFGLKTDKKAEEGELISKRQTWKFAEGILKSKSR